MAGRKKSKKRIKTDKYSTIVKPNLELIEKMARDNFTDEQIAEHFGIAKSTFSRYKTNNALLRKALAKGKELCIAEVENAYYRKALGFEYEEIKIIQKPNGKTQTEIHKKQSLPDEKAMLTILKNKGGWEDVKNTQPIQVVVVGENELE